MKKIWLLVGTVGLVLATSLTWFMASSFKTTAQKAAEAEAPPPSLVTASVVRDTLRSTVPVTCAVGYESSVALQAPGSAGTDQYTRIALGAKERIDQGTLIAEVNGKPVFALIGGFSMYRDLRLDDRGPDAALLNKSLSAMGYQAPRPSEARDIVDERTYKALSELYKHFGYKPLEAKESIPASSFLVLERPSAVVGEPRKTGSVSLGPIAKVSADGVRLRCTGPSGQLAPEATVGKRVTVPSLGTTEYPVTSIVEKLSTSQGSNSEQLRGGSAQNKSEGGESGTQVRPDGTHEDQTEREAFVDLGADADKVRGTVNGQIILEESEPRQLVVPSSALWTKNGETRVTVVDGNESSEIPVKVTFSSAGMNAVEPLSGDLKEGDAVRLGTTGGEGR
ncbi:efflux RND transporter periplasmic adaptor subunit [Rothia uropygialis]|uniref:secretion protein HlyD n=1 Tax=Kocuria sp. 36 TaxID=1415402 RepID=UPI00101B91C6|nr:secretion protein HlyD [Kocuria sp. 36]